MYNDKNRANTAPIVPYIAPIANINKNNNIIPIILINISIF